MPANLHAEAREKWGEASAAKDPKKKLQLMQEFLSLVPKHKGTSNLCNQVKRKITSLRREIEEGKRKKTGKGGGSKFFIEKGGSAQIVIIGLTNVGKSSLLSALTNAKVNISAYPYTTRKPIPGISNYKDIQFQFLEAPAIMEGTSEGKGMGLQTLALARNADGILLMVDLTKDPYKQFSLILRELEKSGILIIRPEAQVEIEKKPAGSGLRVTVMGNLFDCTVKDIEALLKTYHIKDSAVKVYGKAKLDEIENSIFENNVYRPTIIVANKNDSTNYEKKIENLRKQLNNRYPIISISCEKNQGLEKIGETLFQVLEIIRVYTKEPKERDFSKRPFVLKKGATVKKLTKNIHSDLREKFSFAKIWANRLKFSPRTVGSAFLLEDGDIIEIHTK